MLKRQLFQSLKRCCSFPEMPSPVPPGPNLLLHNICQKNCNNNNNNNRRKAGVTLSESRDVCGLLLKALNAGEGSSKEPTKRLRQLPKSACVCFRFS